MQGVSSKIGNGPNFSHKAMKILANEKVNQGIGIKEQEIQLGDTMLWKNHFASAANVASIAMYSAYVMKAMPNKPENENALNNKAQQVPFDVAA